MSARRLFGTDGVRGHAGTKLSASLALSLGRVVAGRASADRPRMLVIRDTRESGTMLEAALAAGAAAAGADVTLGGVLPTPAAPMILGSERYDLAAVVSASHNPFADNGIKFFGPDGYKLADEEEAAIEAALEDEPAPPARIGRIGHADGLAGRYLDALLDRFGGLDLSGVKVVLDCANGATYEVAPAAFTRLGADVTVLADQPDGRNINDGCGSTHPERLIETVRGDGHDIGFAYDGDGDRLIAVDRDGKTVDGDQLLAIVAPSLKQSGRLAGDGVAVTVMTNYGFHRAMAEHGIEVAVTGVGDRNVLAELRERGWSLGGEQSGHVIEMGFVPSGDGIASSLLLLESLAGRDLASSRAMEALPQTLINVPVGDRDAAMADPGLLETVDAENARLTGSGRVLVRASGTEHLIRVMAEAPTEDEAAATCERLAAIVRDGHGA